MREQLVFKIWAENINFKTRLKSAKESGLPEIWLEIFEKIYTLGEILIQNKDKLTQEEFQDFVKFYDMSAIAHNPKININDRKYSVDVMTKLFEDNISRYAFLLKMTKEELVSKMNQEKNKLYGLETVGVKSKVPVTVVGRELALPPVISTDITLPFEINRGRAVTQKPMDTVVVQYPLISEERTQMRALSRKRLEEESNLKFEIRTTLEKAFLNLQSFEGYYESIREPMWLSDIRLTKNPTLKENKKAEMRRHLKYMLAYYENIIETYNGCYKSIVEIQSGRDTATLEEFKNFYKIVKVVEKLTHALKVAVGGPTNVLYSNYNSPLNIPVQEYTDRRKQLQLLVREYNNTLDELFEADANKKKSGFKLG